MRILLGCCVFVAVSIAAPTDLKASALDADRNEKFDKGLRYRLNRLVLKNASALEEFLNEGFGYPTLDMQKRRRLSDWSAKWETQYDNHKERVGEIQKEIAIDIRDALKGENDIKLNTLADLMVSLAENGKGFDEQKQKSIRDIISDLPDSSKELFKAASNKAIEKKATELEKAEKKEKEMLEQANNGDWDTY